MKPISLKIKGINSYVSEQTVDFEKLSQTNLFGIFGETGSGKTTILDSIVLALYGTSERDVIQNLINVNSKSAYITFVFEATKRNSKTRYTVFREFKMRASGLKSEATLQNTKTGEIIAENPDNVNEKILGIIGIGKKEFLKSIALPQGEFDKFLLDTPLNRRRTIARIFDLEHFGQELNEKIKRRKDSLNLRKLNLEDQLELYKDVKQTNIKTLEKNYKLKNQQKIEVEFLLNKTKIELNELKLDYATKTRLQEINSTFAIKKQQKQTIEILKEQIDYTEKYGNFIQINAKNEKCLNEIDNLKRDIKAFEDDLKTIHEKIDVTKKHEQECITKKEEQEKVLNEKKLESEKYVSYSAKLSEKINEIEKLEAELLENNKHLEELKVGLSNQNIISSDLQNSISDVEEKIYLISENIKAVDNVALYELRKNYQALSTILKQNLSDRIFENVESKYLKSLIKQTFNLVDKFDKQNERYLADLEENLKNLNAKTKNIDEFKKEQETKKMFLQESLAVLKEKLSNTLTQTNIMQADFVVSESHTKQLNSKITILNRDKKRFENELSGLCSPKELSSFDKEFVLTCNIYYEIEKVLNDLLNELNSTQGNIEKNSLLISTYEKQSKEYSDVLKLLTNKKYSFDNIKYEMLLSEDEMKVAKKQVNEYEKEFSYLEETSKNLREQIKNKDVSKAMVLNTEKKISMQEEQLQQLTLEVELARQAIVRHNETINKVNEISGELEVVTKNLDTTLELSKLVAGGALIDYVSEEYMFLVTEFANKYVYEISHGKYLLKYDGDFNVVDNFNGGILRTIKTLSGGERFIISLSIALGISQSVATSHNRSLNFFFIDEGFGSLSDGYIEKVLQAFDALIKLDFTVGFITHVDKMEQYITNKILVTKPNNQTGSIITESY